MAYKEDTFGNRRRTRQDNGIWFNNQASCEMHGHKWIPVWFDRKHPATEAALAAHKAAASMAAGGGMIFQKWTNPPTDTICDSAACRHRDSMAVPRVTSIPMTAAGWQSNAPSVAFNTEGISLTSKGWIRSSLSFKRPLRVEFEAKLALTAGQRPDCMGFQVFAGNAGRHSGYNFGVDGWRNFWWGSTDGSMVKRGKTVPAFTRADWASEYHTYSVSPS
jgi:hypothetical protein